MRHGAGFGLGRRANRLHSDNPVNQLCTGRRWILIGRAVPSILVHEHQTYGTNSGQRQLYPVFALSHTVLLRTFQTYSCLFPNKACSILGNDKRLRSPHQRDRKFHLHWKPAQHLIYRQFHPRAPWVLSATHTQAKHRTNSVRFHTCKQILAFQPPEFGRLKRTIIPFDCWKNSVLIDCALGLPHVRAAIEAISESERSA